MEFLGKNTCFKNGDEYFIVTSGKIEGNEHMCFTRTRNRVRVKKLKWVADKTVLLPINNFKDRKYFFVDHYVLAIDENVKEINWPPNDLMLTENVYESITNVLKLVKYEKLEDKYKNYDVDKHTSVSTDN